MSKQVISTQKKEKGLRLKLLPKEGEGCYLAPASEADIKSSQYLKLKSLLGAEYFRDSLPIPQHPDVQFEEIGEEDDVVDIDIDPSNINDAEVEVIKALYEDKEYEEIEDDFIQKANLDEVLEQYEEGKEVEEDIKKVSKAELEDALNEFVSEHQVMFNNENTKIFEFEGIPFEQDLVLQAVIAKGSDSEEEMEKESTESESEDDVVSNASHFTNTDNRPEVVSVRMQAKKERKEKKKVVKEEEEKKGESGLRGRNETKEEKKSRKEKIKAEKKAIREEKKKRRVESKEEKIKEAARTVGTYDVRQGTSVMKLG